MKRKYYVLCFLMIMLYSCEKEYYWEYVIQNETNSEILIEGFDRFDWKGNRLINYSNPLEEIDIKPDQNFSVRRGRGLDNEPLGIFENFEIDSVNIIFDNKKIIIQVCDEHALSICDFERNILAYDTEYKREKTGRSSGENEYRFIYTITEEDYNNAVPIEE